MDLKALPTHEWSGDIDGIHIDWSPAAAAEAIRPSELTDNNQDQTPNKSAYALRFEGEILKEPLFGSPTVVPPCKCPSVIKKLPEDLETPMRCSKCAEIRFRQAQSDDFKDVSTAHHG